MTYSEIVQLLSSHMVPSNSNPSGPADSIPILEKFSLSRAPDSGQQLDKVDTSTAALLPTTDQNMPVQEY